MLLMLMLLILPTEPAENIHKWLLFENPFISTSSQPLAKVSKHQVPILVL